jgi:hypothetical protein
MSAPTTTRRPVAPPAPVVVSLKGRRSRRPAPDHDVLALLPVLALLHEAIDRRIDLHISFTDLDGLGGLSQFSTGLLYVERDQPDEQIRWALVHELLHHLHGDPGGCSHDLEERRIEGAVGATMLDVAASLALQVHAERTEQDVADVDTNRARSRLIAAVERHLAGAR